MLTIIFTFFSFFSFSICHKLNIKENQLTKTLQDFLYLSFDKERINGLGLDGGLDGAIAQGGGRNVNSSIFYQWIDQQQPQ